MPVSVTFEGKISVLFSDYELTGPCIDFCLDNRADCKVECSLRFYTIGRSALNYGAYSVIAGNLLDKDRVRILKFLY